MHGNQKNAEFLCMTNQFLYRRKKFRKKKAYSNESKPLRQTKFKNVYTIIVGQERTIFFFVIKKC